jgi:transposase
MKAITLYPLSNEAIQELDELYRTTKDVRVRTRAQMVLLSGEQGWVADEIAVLVRQNDQTVRLWLKRYQAEGIAGLYDDPRSGAPGKVNQSYKEKLIQTVRQRPRSLGLPYSLWTSQRLADYMAEETGIRVHEKTVRHHLKAEEIVLSRPQHKISSPDPEYQLKKRRLKRSEII